jgi:hypothetical protein
VTAASAGPVRLDARLDEHLSRWLWLVKWVLVIPHVLVLAVLWIAFAVLSVVAWFAILITGRYPESIFAFTTGVLAWTWRVAYYSYGGLGTDRYPPFSLGEHPEYPATLHITPPADLSRGLVLVKWLLALPHYLVVAFFVGGGAWAGTRAADTVGTWPASAGLIGLLVLFGAIALLFTGRYPRGIFDVVLGMQRWILRVVAYCALMTDTYPPFRLDVGGTDPASLAVAPQATAVASARPAYRWSPMRVTAVVVGSLLVAGALGTGAGATALLVADRTGRDAAGFLSTPPVDVSTTAYAVVADPVELWVDDAGDPMRVSTDPASVLGTVRLTAVSSRAPVFVGVGPSDEVHRYLDGVAQEAFGGNDGRARVRTAGGAPSAPPTGQPFWAASAAGGGTQQLSWTPVPGRWAVVVMNADGGRPVVADVTAAVTAPALAAVWTGLFVAAGLLLLAGVVCVGLAVPRGPAPVGPGPDGPGGAAGEAPPGGQR